MHLLIPLGLAWVVLTLAVTLVAAYFAKRRGPSVLIATYSGLVVISVTTATKLIDLGWYVPAGVIVYSASFLVTDLIAEVYGKEKATIAVWSGFFVMILFFLYSAITVMWPAAPYWQLQDSYENILGLSSRIAFAGALAFIISQLLDVTIFHYMKTRFDSRYPWMRNNVSTMISQLVDTVLFISLAFYGVFPIIDLIIAQYVIKLFIAAIDTPFFLIGRKILNADSELREQPK